MSDREFFQNLEEQWKQEDSLPEMTLEQAMAARRRQQVKSSAHFMLSLFSLLVAAYFLSQPFSLVITGAGITLVAATVVDWVYVWRYRRPVSRWEDWSMKGLLEYRLALLNADIRNARYYLFSSFGLLAFTAFLWFVAAFDTDFRLTGFHQIFSTISIPVALVIIVFFGRGNKDKQRRQKLLVKMVADFSDAP